MSSFAPPTHRKKLPDESEAAVLSKIRWVHNYLGNYEKAQEYAIKALSIFKTDDFQKRCLQISDNGVGKTASTDSKNSTGFGSKLVQILSQKLKGKPEFFQSENGYLTLIRFENFKMAR